MDSFHVEIVKPSHYDKDGYVIQWWRAWVPSNSLACLYGIARDCAERKVLGGEVAIEVAGCDEVNVKVPIRSIIARLKRPGHSGLVCLAGVQSNQFPRAMALAREFRAHGLTVAIGGFHVSGCLAMLPELTPELKEALDLGIILFAGEAEEQFETLLRDVRNGMPQPIYNHMNALPNLQGQTTPYLPRSYIKRYEGAASSFDAGRGCPFQCSFCTIINVQGRKSRWRGADDIERIVVENAAQNITRFFITDDNFARNKNWETIFDRLIELREERGLGVTFLIQVDTLAHKIPNFIEKARRAGCNYVFVGMESINPENLQHMKKPQNRITEYRSMIQAWKQAGVLVYAGFIIGLPSDTAESIRRDVEIIKKELAVDLLEFTILTPLPGSEDHKKFYEAGTWMDPDLNKYDLENVTIEPGRMSRDELQRVYDEAWGWFYTDEHVARIIRRNMAYGIKTLKPFRSILQVYGAPHFEGVHPQQGGFFRRKSRKERRPERPRVPALVFYPAHAWQTLTKYSRYAGYVAKLHRIRRRVEREWTGSYTDLAITPVIDAEGEALEMFELNAASRAAVDKARRQVRDRLAAQQTAAADD